MLANSLLVGGVAYESRITPHSPNTDGPLTAGVSTPVAAAVAGAEAVIIYSKASEPLNGTLGSPDDGYGPTTGIPGADGQGVLVEERQTSTTRCASPGGAPRRSASSPPGTTSRTGRSDYQPSIVHGVPASGPFTGADGMKTEEGVAMFGGTAGLAYDSNYHTAEDDLDNVDGTPLEIMSKAIAAAT